MFRVNVGGGNCKGGYADEGENGVTKKTNAVLSPLSFGSIHGADTAPLPKPAPDGLLLVCHELNVEPAAAVYVGDSPSDAVAAQAAGMTSIGVTWGSHSRESLQEAPFHVICETVNELASVLGVSMPVSTA